MWDLDKHEYRVEEDRGDFEYKWWMAGISLALVVPLMGGIWVLKQINEVICHLFF